MPRSNALQRRIDRYIGIPLIALLGWTKRQNSITDQPNRIGIMQPSAIGDMVLISGLLVHLRRCYPRAEIHVFHGPFNGSVVELLPTEVVAHSCVFTRPWATLRQLRGAKLDILINCAPWTRLTAVLTALSGATTKVGFRSPGQGIHPIFDIAVPYENNRHELENHRALAELFGPLAEYVPQLNSKRTPPSLQLPYESLVILHAPAGGSGAKQKSWPAENWARLAQTLIAEGCIVALTGDKKDHAVADAILADVDDSKCVSLVGDLTLAQLCFVLTRARLLVTIDTGIAHLAAALNTPVVGLYGPTKSARWGISNELSIAIDSPHPASGYINYGFERHPQGDEIMSRISVESVVAAVEVILARTGSTKLLNKEKDAAESATSMQHAPAVLEPTRSSRRFALSRSRVSNASLRDLQASELVSSQDRAARLSIRSRLAFRSFARLGLLSRRSD